MVSKAGFAGLIIYAIINIALFITFGYLVSNIKPESAKKHKELKEMHSPFNAPPTLTKVIKPKEMASQFRAQPTSIKVLPPPIKSPPLAIKSASPIKVPPPTKDPSPTEDPSSSDLSSLEDPSDDRPTWEDQLPSKDIPSKPKRTNVIVRLVNRNFNVINETNPLIMKENASKTANQSVTPLNVTTKSSTFMTNTTKHDDARKLTSPTDIDLKRSVRDMQEDDTDDVILKIVDDEGIPRVEVKVNNKKSKRREKKNTKSKKLERNMFLENNRKRKNKPQVIVLKMFPNKTFSFEEEDNKMFEEDTSIDNKYKTYKNIRGNYGKTKEKIRALLPAAPGVKFLANKSHSFNNATDDAVDNFAEELLKEILQKSVPIITEITEDDIVPANEKSSKNYYVKT